MAEVPAPKHPTLPVAKDGELYGHIGRYAGQIVLTAFEMMGGLERLVDWAERNPDTFYTKLFPKIIAKPHQVEHGASQSLEAAIKALDAKTIDGEVIDGGQDSE